MLLSLPLSRHHQAVRAARCARAVRVARAARAAVASSSRRVGGLLN